MLSIAVVGAGRAGQARVRALEANPAARLHSVVRRGGAVTLDHLIADPAVDAIAICTPNLLHPDQVQRALAGGKHVLVEFPLAPQAELARQLLSSAARRGLVLHVEHIELLSNSQLIQRERAAPLGRLMGGELCFTGSSSGWIGDSDLAGSPALRAVARLHRLVDLFGGARVESAELETRDRGYRLSVSLEFAGGAPIQLIEERGPELARETRWALRCEHGLLGDPPPGHPGELFREDLDCFVERVAGREVSYLADARILHVLDLVGEIERCTGAAS